MAMNDEAFVRQRRNLISMSIVLLLYVVAGGDVKSLFGVGLSLMMKKRNY